MRAVQSYYFDPVLDRIPTLPTSKGKGGSFAPGGHFSRKWSLLNPAKRSLGPDAAPEIARFFERGGLA